jgi:hypothetical protein
MTQPSGETDTTAAPRRLAMLVTFLAFAVAGVFVFCHLPPLWHAYDGLIQITRGPSDMTLLHYPAAYPLFSRLHVWAAQCFGALFGSGSFPTRLRDTVVLNDLGVLALIVSQQIALAAALACFTLSCARSWGARLLTAILLLSNASLFLMAQLVSSDALTAILAVMIVAAGARVFCREPPSPKDSALYAVALFAAIMTRHANAVFAGLLPLAFLFLWLRGRFRMQAVLRRAGYFTLVGLACIVAAHLTTRTLGAIYGVKPRPIGARAASERLGFVAKMPEPERAAFLQSLQARSDDPIVQQAIPALARSVPWTEQRAEIEKLLRARSPELTKRETKLQADFYLDRTVRLFYRSLNPWLMRDTAESIRCAFAEENAAGVNSCFLKIASWSLDLYPSHVDLKEQTAHLAVCSPLGKECIAAFEKNAWVGLWKIPHGAVLLAGALGAVALLWRGQGGVTLAVFALATAGITVTSTGLTLIFVNYLPRYTALTDIGAFLTVALVISAWIDSPAGRIKAWPGFR